MKSFMFVFCHSISFPCSFIKKGLSLIRINKQLLKFCKKIFFFFFFPLDIRYQFSKWHQFKYFTSHNLFSNPFPFVSIKSPRFNLHPHFFQYLNLQSFRKTFIFRIRVEKNVCQQVPLGEFSRLPCSPNNGGIFNVFLRRGLFYMRVK